jgi:hypothetical protein
MPARSSGILTATGSKPSAIKRWKPRLLADRVQHCIQQAVARSLSESPPVARKDKTNNQSNNKAKEISSLDQVDAGGPAENKSQAYIEADKKTKLQDIIATRIKELGYLAGYNDNILRFLQFRWFGKGDAVQGSPVDNGVLVTQLAVNSLISKYLLPVFAALLGVTVYILRTASADMQALSFRIYDSGIYSNRLTLGVVGGIAISWFSVTETHGIVGSITPAALAFLVGYSVEVLYNVLDSLVKALGANSK